MSMTTAVRRKTGARANWIVEVTSLFGMVILEFLSEVTESGTQEL